MALVDSDDIATLLGITLTPEEEDAIDMYIEFAVAEIEAWLGRPVTVRTFTELVEPDVDGNVYLHNTPVHTVTSVKLNGDEQNPNSYIVQPWGLSGDWYGTFSPVHWGSPSDALEVTYTAGLDMPAAVNSLIAQGVVRKFYERKGQITQSGRDSIGVKQIKVEDYSVTYDTGAAATTYSAGGSPILIFQSDNDFNGIKRYKRRAIG